ncbi:MAG TPA: phosphoadenylyl-sulfate reductase [Rhizomicrobium sp.]
MELRTSSTLDSAARAVELNGQYDKLKTKELLRALIVKEFPGQIALVCSFGTESAVLLHLVADIDCSLPVIFLDTGKHFDETISYRDSLVERFGLTDVRVVTPAEGQLAANDDKGVLHRSNPDRCCYIRKTLPMLSALREFSCWINGRKRFQGTTRAELELFEAQDKWIKVSPLVNWSEDRIQAYFADHNLPHHPLEAYGYSSIGCSPCTEPNHDTRSDRRSGRWKGSAKLECGIHLPICENTGAHPN